jgi:hypothetical protein
VHEAFGSVCAQVAECRCRERTSACTR